MAHQLRGCAALIDDPCLVPGIHMRWLTTVKVSSRGIDTSGLYRYQHSHVCMCVLMHTHTYTHMHTQFKIITIIQGDGLVGKVPAARSPGAIMWWKEKPTPKNGSLTSTHVPCVCTSPSM